MARSGVEFDYFFMIIDQPNNEQGWVKLHRSAISSSVWTNQIYWRVWCWCLLKASWHEQKFPFNAKDIVLKPGQFIAGRKKACEEIGVTEQQYRSAISYLKSTNRITTKPTNKYTLISVINWDKYQAKNQENNQQENQQETNNQPTDNHIQESKEDKDILNTSPEGRNLKNKGMQSLKDLLPGHKSSTKNSYHWQEEAEEICEELNVSSEKRSSIFKCFKDDHQRAKFAIIDCRESGVLTENYFLKIFNNLKNVQGGKADNSA